MKWGSKTFILANSSNYILLLLLFICSNYGKADVGYIRKLSATGSVVVRLLDSLLGNNHILFMDRFYNSPLLFKYLSDRNTDASGTAMPNRKFSA